MAWTSVGFDGTITEIQWAGLAGLLGNGYVAAGNGDCLVTAVGGARQVSIAAGSLYGDGVLSTNSGAETVALTTPTNGQWYVIALRRTWATNTAALVAIAGATTTTTTPTAPPTSFPTLNTNVGVLTDQPIAWAWCNSANTTVVVYDIRLKAVKSLPPVVANGTERDAKFMTPTQGLQVWRDDLGAVETYFGLYNASTNPGGRDAAGWYRTTRQSGLVPIRATTATAVSGSATVNDLGVITFSGCTSIQLDGIFTSEFRSYKLIFNAGTVSAAATILGRVRNAGTAKTSNYYSGWTRVLEGGATVTGALGGSSYFFVSDVHPSVPITNSEITIYEPRSTTKQTCFYDTHIGFAGSSTYAGYTGGTVGGATEVFDGFQLDVSTGTFGGTFQVFGIND